jgi:hypothetical protein
VQKSSAFIITAREYFMNDMTEEEADALDEYFTKNLPKVDPSKGGITTRQGFRMVALDRISEDYLLTMSLATKKTPTEIIGDMVREKIAVSQ